MIIFKYVGQLYNITIMLRIACFFLTLAIITAFNQTVSIQTTDQIFYTYIPYTTETCVFINVSSARILQGNLIYTQITQTKIFYDLYYSCQLTFWSLIINGMVMQLNPQLLFNNSYSFNQILLFNSSIQQNLRSRQVILTNIINQTIIFTYVLPFYYKNNQTYQINFVRNLTISFNNSEINAIINLCQYRGGFIVFSYVGGDIYVGYCPNTSYIFFWDINNVSSATIISNLTDVNIQNVTNNPDTLLPFDYNFDVTLTLATWNLAIFTQQQTLFLCVINLSGMNCDDFDNQNYIIEVLAQRLWGLYNGIQTTAIQIILTQYPFIKNYDYPGQIENIYTIGDTIYIESTYQENDKDVINLILFESGILLVNATLIGEISYYGSSNLIIETIDNQFYLTQFILPLYIIQSNLQQNNTLIAQCQDFRYAYFYNIIWSNFQYPKYQIISLTNVTPTSFVDIHIQYVQDNYQVIGPAFDIFIQDNTDITIEIVNQNQFFLTEELLDIIKYLVNQKNQIQALVYLNGSGLVKTYYVQNNITITNSQPCELQYIGHVFHFQKKLLFYSRPGGQGCLCDLTRNNCQIIPQQAITQQLYTYSTSKGQYFKNLKKMHTIQSQQFIIGQQQIQNTDTFNDVLAENQIKTQLLQSLDEDLVINVYRNNTISLVNISSYDFYSIDSGCSNYDTTNAVIFRRSFYYNSLIFFCYNSSYITQYYIRNLTLIFNRKIPLYGFKTTDNDFSALSGNSFIFLQVYPLQDWRGHQSYIYSNYCCILRLDPKQYTVSVIVEIIQSNDLIFIYSIFLADIVVYNQTSIVDTQYYVKIYANSAYILFDQSALCSNVACSLQTYQYSISFLSNYYNFAGYFYASIFYNISASILIVNGNFQNYSIITLQGYYDDISIFTKIIPFNFNFLCGPIGQYYLQVVDTAYYNAVFTHRIYKVISKNKIINDIGSHLIQIIDIHDYQINNTLNQLLMIVGVENTTFYIKYGSTWLQYLQTVKNVQINCFYYVYEVVNYTTITFGTNCYNYKINIPLLTVTYDPESDDPLFFQVAYYNLPIQLRQISSFYQTGGPPLLIGLGQGPSKSLSGSLFICNQSCYTLSLNINSDFFLNYAELSFDGNFIVAALNLNSVVFWINPWGYPSNVTNIIANYSINYRQISNNLFCTMVKFVYGSLTMPSILLSCNDSYIQANVNFSSNSMTAVLNFDKFSNCQDVDKFQPDFIIQQGTNSTIQILVTQCQFIFNSIEFEQIQTISAQNKPVYTGYIMVYIASGPMCGPNTWSPIQIIDISTTMDFRLYTIYNANNQFKLLYESLPGLLIDNFISNNIQLFYQVLDLSKQTQFPLIQLTIVNSYSQINYYIVTQSEIKVKNQILIYVLLGIFIFVNLITLICLLIWCIRHRKNQEKTIKINHNDTDTTKQIKSQLDEDGTNIQASLKPRQFEYGKEKKGRRFTEIQLFQPR